MIKCDYILGGGEIMRIRIIAGGLGVFMLASGAAQSLEAAYIIRLKNGNEYVTERYWQKGTQILFDTYGGVFGVEKRFISKIEKTDKPGRVIAVSSIAPEQRAIEANVKNSDEAKSDEAKKDARENQEQVLHKRNEDDPSELSQLVKELGDLKRAMQLTGKTNEFLAEFGEIHDLGDRVEEALKGRR
jgi:hypothetical protein